MKKFLSALFSLIIFAVIAAGIYFNQPFAKRQINKVRGMFYVYKGDKAYQDMEMQHAISFYNTGLRYYPQHYGAWYNLGNIYVAYEDYESALYAYSKAFEYNPRMMIARMNYGIVSTEKLGDFESALEQYEKVISTKRRLLSIPYIFNNKISYKLNKAIAYYNIGVTYRLMSIYANDDYELQRKYLTKAIEAYKSSLAINPKSYDTLYNLGLAYHISGIYDEAGKCYCKAIGISPMSYEAHYNLAILLRKLGHYSEAYEEIEKASTLIGALNENSAVQEYAAIVMNDIMRNVYFNEDYKKRLNDALSQEKSKIKKHMSKKELKSVETKKDKENGTITSVGINFVNGKIVTTDELDKEIIKDFGTCGSMQFFEYADEDLY